MFRKNNFLLHLTFLCLGFAVSPFTAQECDKTKCSGPLKFYEEVKCKPIYKNPGDCCAEKYDCSHLEERFRSKKCYVNDNVYEISEKIKEEDSLPCTRNCICLEKPEGQYSDFNCPIEDCFQQPPKEGCYLENNPGECCPGREICPTDPAICVVDGETYKEGDYFVPKSQPDTSCYCKPGYKGENVEPFCYTQNQKSCGNELRNVYEIKEKCAPIYHYQKSPQTTCNLFFRCPDEKDRLIASIDKHEKISDDESNTCTFGKIKMQVGDELNQITDDMYKCIKCKCEVPPIVTCQQISEKSCEETINHEAP